MSKHTSKRSRAPRPSAPARPTGVRRTALVALTGAAVAIAGTAAWMTLGASAMSSNSPTQTPATAQAQPQQTPAQTQAPAAAANGAVKASAPAQTAARQTPAVASAAPAAASTSAPGAAGQQAFIDPATGKLRPAEHDEVAALNKQTAGAKRLARTAQTAAEPQEFATEGGAMGVLVPDELQPYTVATKTADGGVAIEHVTGAKAADAKVRANSKKGVSPAVSQIRKGEPNDR